MDEALKVVLKANKETEDPAKDFVDEYDIYALICRMSALNGALVALSDGLLNKQDAEDTLSGCEYITRDIISDLRDLHKEATK